MGIFRFNQNGVASNIMLGRAGGKITWDTTQFAFTKPDGTPAELVIRNDKGEAGIAATRDDLDRKVQGLRTKKAVAVHVTTQTNILAALSGVYDGVTYAKDMRVLFSGQTNKKENGIYVLDLALIPTRTEDANTYLEIEGAYVYVMGGTVGGTTGWVLNVLDDSNPLVAIDLFDIEVKQFHGQGSVHVNTGLKMDATKITLDFNALPAAADAVQYTDTLVVNRLDVHSKVPVETLLTDLGVSSWKIGNGDNIVSVSANRTTPRDTIVFGVKATATHAANTSALTVSASSFNLNYAVPASVAGTQGSMINLVAGAGNLEKGGDIKITGGIGDGSSMRGGDIILTPGAGTSSNADNGLVRIASKSGLVLPFGATAERPLVAERGLIRINTDIVTSVDTVEFFDSQKGSWKAVGGGVRLEDLDKDTYISVASSSTGDEDEITLFVGGGPDHNPTAVFKASHAGLVIATPNGKDPLVHSGSNIDILAGSGLDGGNINISTGQAGGLGGEPAGKMDVLAHGGLVISTGNTSVDSGSVEITTGNSPTTVGSISIETGSGPNSQLSIGTVYNQELELGNSTSATATARLSGGASVKIGTEINAGPGTKVLQLGDRSTTATELRGKTVKVLGEMAIGGKVDILAANIAIGNDASTTSISIGNTLGTTAADSTNVTIIGETLSLSANTNMVIKAATEHQHVRFETTGTGVLEVTNPLYAAGVTADAHIPNRKFVSDAFVNATLGGTGRRSARTTYVESGVSFSLGADLPANARVTKITYEVVQAFVHTTGIGVSLVAGAGFASLASNNDLDLATPGIYIVEYSGNQTSGGGLNLLFSTELSGATAGELYVNVEFFV